MSQSPAITVPSHPGRPGTKKEILYWLEAGRIQPESALRHLREREESPSSETVRRAASGSANSEAVAQALNELDDLVGLTQIKAAVRELRAFVEIQRRRAEVGLKTEPHVLHMIFKGSPGTGKTTVARVVGRLLHALDVLPKGHVVEVERADLVGEYIGHTAQKTRDLIRRAMGGVLFIDEAYSLARGGDKDFGKEAIDTLVKSMEDFKNQWVLVLAGYSQEMTRFLETNPGLRSRFPLTLDFPDYSPVELVAITRQMLRARQYYLNRDAEAELLQWFELNRHQWHIHAGNARMVRNLLEKAIRRQSVRLIGQSKPLTREELMQLSWSDFAPVVETAWKR